MTESGRSKVLWAGLALVVAVTLVAGLWLGRPTYRSFKERRAMAQAKSFLDQQDLPNGLLSLRQALALNPSNLEAVVMMAELATVSHSPQMLAWRKRAAELDPSIRNRLLLATAGLQVERPPFPIATEVLNALAPVGGTNVAYQLLATQLALRLNRPADALRHLETAALIEPTNKLHQLNLATLRLQSPDWSVSTMAREHLAALVDDTNYSAIAMRSLAADALRREQISEARQWVDRLLQQSQSEFSDRLLQLTVLDKADNAELGEALRVTQAMASTNVPSIVSTAQWMVGHDRAGAALDWIQSLPVEVQQEPNCLLAQAECYLGTRDWSGLELWLGGQDWKQQECVRLTLLSKALKEQGRAELADANWRRAVGAAGSQPEAIATLSRLAAAWGWDDQLESLLWSATRDRNSRGDWAFKALGSFYQSRTNTAGLYRLHQALLEKHPQSVVLKNNTAMMGLLLGRDVEKATNLARSAYEAEKTNASVVSTYAYALHLEGRTTEALALMATLNEEQLQQPSIALYQAVLLQAAGQPERAHAYAAAASRAPLLLPEEAALLQALEH